MAAWLRRRLGVNCFYLLVRPLEEARPAPGACGLDFRTLAEEELLAHCQDPELDLRESRVREACARGDVCVGALEAGRLVGYVWFAFRSAPHVKNIRVDFGPRLRYAYKMFVRPDRRGRGIARELLARGAELCPRRDTHLGLSFVALDNKPSLRAFAAAGWKVAGYAGYVEWFGWWRAFASAGAARLGARFCA